MMSMAGIEPNRAATALRYQASDTATILTMVREGLGITLMPRMSLPPKTPGVVVIPFEPVVPLQVGLSLRSRKMATPATKLFVDTALRWAQAQSALHAPVD
jgi:DNA-binding transcriptional LysR family regulator